MASQINKEFGFAIHDAARLLTRRFEALAQHHGFTLPQWRVIGQLSRSDSLSQTALAKLIETDQVTLGGLVRRLEDKGLIIRTADPSDSRAKIVSLTDKAHALIGELSLVTNDVYDQAFKGISDADRATIISVLTRLVANLSNEPVQARDS